MAEPATTAALALAGLGWFGGQIAGGVVGNASDRIFCGVVRGVRDRVAGMQDQPQKQDVAKAVRTAQVQALERIVRDYRAVGRPEWEANPYGPQLNFFERTLGFCAEALGRCVRPAVKLNIEVTEPLTASIDGILATPVHDGPAARRAEAIKFFAEEAVLDELREVLDGLGLPDGFEAHFRSGAEGRPGFLDVFGAYIAKQLKENERFRAIYTSGQLARIEGFAFDATEMLARIEKRFGGALRRLEDTTAEIRAEQQQQTGMLAELLALARTGGAFARAAESGISEAAVRAIVERLGGEGIGRDELIAWLDEWIRAAQRELGRHTNEGAAFEAARREAARRFREGRIGEASAALMDEFAHEEREEAERQDERKRRRLRLLEEAIRFDELAFDGEAAAAKLRLIAEAEGITGLDAFGRWLRDKADEYYERGETKGENAALLVAIATYRAALEERTRDRVPLDWAMTKNGLGRALFRLGERESSAARLEEAAAAHRAVLEAQECGPLHWADAQHGLGNALWRLGERESGTARLDEAVSAYRAALEERPRESVPLSWAMTQNNLGNTLLVLGERESGTARLDEAVSAYRAALEEWTRERVPLDWARAQNNLGTALHALGERENATTCLDQAVCAYRAALEEWTRERVPLDWARVQNNLGTALQALGERGGGTARLAEAVSAYGAALEEQTRERVPLDWALTQNNQGEALYALGLRCQGTAELEKAVSSYRAALGVFNEAHASYYIAYTGANLERAVASLADRRRQSS